MNMNKNMTLTRTTGGVQNIDIKKNNRKQDIRTFHYNMIKDEVAAATGIKNVKKLKAHIADIWKQRSDAERSEWRQRQDDFCYSRELTICDDFKPKIEHVDNVYEEKQVRRLVKAEIKRQKRSRRREKCVNRVDDNRFEYNYIQSAIDLIDRQYEKKTKRDIWANSPWKNIAALENDDVGKVGEQIIESFCKRSSIDCDIDGTKTKKAGGGIGDGNIYSRSVEIKTARLGSCGNTFQHELGEVPWNAEYMIFLDIAPTTMYITIFPNFSEEFYKKSGRDSSCKCAPYFPTKSVTWRKQKGAFKLDTSIRLNEHNVNNDKYVFKIDTCMHDVTKFKHFVASIITPPT